MPSELVTPLPRSTGKGWLIATGSKHAVPVLSEARSATIRDARQRQQASLRSRRGRGSDHAE